MIKNITGGTHINVIGSTASYPYFSTNPNNPMLGMVRLNNNNFEVFDGSSWQMLTSSYPTIELSGVAQTAVNWALTKMSEESRIAELAKTHPAVEDAVQYFKQAEDRLKVIVALTEKESKNEVA